MCRLKGAEKGKGLIWQRICARKVSPSFVDGTCCALKIDACGSTLKSRSLKKLAYMAPEVSSAKGQAKIRVFICVQWSTIPCYPYYSMEAGLQ